MFETISQAPADPILGLTEAFKADSRPEKINLGVGVYKDDSGKTPILNTVKKAEAILLETEDSKGYLSITGVEAYGIAVQSLLFGQGSEVISGNRAVTAQAPGGTGALRTGGNFIRSQLGEKTIWVSNPTWANHNAVFTAAGLSVKQYSYYDAETKGLDFAAMKSDLEKLGPDDVVLLHGCCHNPTGVDPTLDQWKELAEISKARGWLPFFDFAYQGFAVGVEEDASGLRVFAEVCPELLIASSFSKNFGLYSERVGAFTLVAADSSIAQTALSQIKVVIRSNYSNPPAHGALVVTTILNDDALKAEWLEELAQMRKRIKDMRGQFVAKLKALGVDQDFSFIDEQNGMFSFSGLNKDQVNKLKADFGIYIVGSGRISVAGITSGNIDALCKGIAEVL